MATKGINPNDIIEIDYSDHDIAAQKMQPTVYKDGDSFSCLSGPDPETGIFGSGDTPAAAIDDWKSALAHKLKKFRGDNPEKHLPSSEVNDL